MYIDVTESGEPVVDEDGPPRLEGVDAAVWGSAVSVPCKVMPESGGATVSPRLA